jgi:predicted glycoside hydrolase/deacetylase ChbG (UPF0249 family)
MVLTSGEPVSKPADVPLLVNASGRFCHGFVGILQLVRRSQATAAEGQIERELRAQCEKIMARGIRFDHIDGHRYVHMIPEIWRIVVRLAAEYGCPYVRLADEKWPGIVSRRGYATVVRNLPKKLLLSSFASRNRPELARAIRPVRTADHMVGVLDSGAMTSDCLQSALVRAAAGVTEIVMHPGLPDASASASINTGGQTQCAETDERFLASAGRRLELEALTSAAVAEVVARRGINLTSFSRLAADASCAA